MFTLICARINTWVNSREAGDLRRYRTHYDVIVMHCKESIVKWQLMAASACPDLGCPTFRFWTKQCQMETSRKGGCLVYNLRYISLTRRALILCFCSGMLMSSSIKQRIIFGAAPCGTGKSILSFNRCTPQWHRNAVYNTTQKKSLLFVENVEYCTANSYYVETISLLLHNYFIGITVFFTLSLCTWIYYHCICIDVIYVKINST